MPEIRLLPSLSDIAPRCLKNIFVSGPFIFQPNEATTSCLYVLSLFYPANPVSMNADGEVRFYELETIAEENGTLILRLKHFGPSLTGWEEKDKTIGFGLVKVTPNKVYFEGFTIERIHRDQLVMYVVIHDEDEPKEVAFPYKRVTE